MRRIIVAGLVLSLLFAGLPLEPVRAAPILNYEFWRTWARTDLPVQSGETTRTWMWGPEAFADPLLEPYAESPGGRRLVQYFDKTRMEINNPNGNLDDPWYVTNGHLAKELVTGRMQVGDWAYEEYWPAEINIAGDLDDPTGPTYASFNRLLHYEPIPTGWTITQTVDRDGNVGNDPSLASYGVTAAHYVAETNHNVASVFWNFMNGRGLIYESGSYTHASLFPNPFYAVGLPLTEAYWTTVKVGGVSNRVLVQVFERRVLTYTPNNPDGWKVEAGNVGMHYYWWRYWDIFGGWEFCSTLDTPSYVDPFWSHPNLAVSDYFKKRGTHWTPNHPGWEDRPLYLRGLYALVTAEEGCFNADTAWFANWVTYFLDVEGRPLGDEEYRWIREKAFAQVEIAIYQPQSPLGQKMRQIEAGLDPLRHGGPEAYWTYLIGPVVYGTKGGTRLWQSWVSTMFQQYLEWYRVDLIVDPLGTPDFGTYLARQGFRLT